MSTESFQDQQDNNNDQPALPLEIFGHIFDIMLDSGQRMSDESLTKEKSSDLRSYSLVCKGFAMLTRPHLFRSVNVWLDGGNNLIGQFVQLLEDYPRNKAHIRGVCFSTAYMKEGFATETDTEIYNKTLLELPRLEAITIRYNPPSMTLLQQPLYLPPQSDIQAFVNHIVETYTLRGMLQTFNAARIYALPLSALTSCPSLSSLRLHRFSDTSAMAKECRMSSSIKALSLSNMPVPISMLLNFPNLEKLQVSYVSFSPKGDQLSGSLTPLSALKEFSFEMDDEDLDEELTALLAFVGAYASIRQVKPFKTLERLRLQLDYPHPNLSVFSSLFEHLESLQTLDISVRMSWGHNGSQWSLVRNLNIDGHMKTSFKRLKSLSLKITSRPRSSSYQLPKDDLSHFFLSMPSQNYVENITLDIPIDILTGPDQDLGRNPWPCLVKILTSPSHFPHLQAFWLAIDFRFVIPGVNNLTLPDSLDPALSHWIVPPCMTAMRRAITELGHRSNLTFNPYFRPLPPCPDCLRFRCTILIPRLGSYNT